MRARPPLEGLATERTALAWTRTALAAVALGGLFAHAGATASGVRAVAAWLAAGCALALGAGAWLYGHALYEHTRTRLHAGLPVVKPGDLRWVSRAVVALALGALMVAFA